MTVQDLEEWRKQFSTWLEFADHVGYHRRHIEKIRKGELPIPARLELLWIKENNS